MVSKFSWGYGFQNPFYKKALLHHNDGVHLGIFLVFDSAPPLGPVWSSCAPPREGAKDFCRAEGIS